jgi:hypothetical protein
MGKLSGILTTVFLFVSISYAQELTPQNIFNSHRTYVNGDIQVEFDDTKFIIINQNGETYSKEIAGRKILKISPGGKYFLIANHAFPQDKSDYLITLSVFDNSGNEIFEKNIKAYFDMPHPLFAINDDGIAAGFDPLYFKFITISKNEIKESAVIKDAPFEMERAAFIQADSKEFYVLSSIEPLSIEHEKANVSLFRINSSDGIIEQTGLDLSTPVLLKIIENELYVSGIKFTAQQPVQYLFKFTKNLQTTVSNNIAVERLVKSGSSLFGKYADKIFKLNIDLTIEKVYSSNLHARVLDLAADKSAVYALITDGNNLYLSNFNSELEMISQRKLAAQKILGSESIQTAGGKLLLHLGDKTVEY